MDEKPHIRLTISTSSVDTKFVTKLRAAFASERVDYEEQIQRSAVKHLEPLELIITAVATWTIERLILEPFFQELSMQWRNAITKSRSPLHPIHMKIQVPSLDFEFVSSEDFIAREHIDSIFDTFVKTVAILHEHSELGLIRQVRIEVGETIDDVKVICYEGNRPKYVVEVPSRRLIRVFEEKSPSQGVTTAENFIASELRISELYRQMVERYR